MGRKRKLPVLLVTIEIGETTLKNNMEVPLKTENR